LRYLQRCSWCALGDRRRNRLPPGRWLCRGLGYGRAVVPLLGTAGVRAVRDLVPGGAAADVLVQQPLRRMSGVRRARDALRDRAGPDRPGWAQVVETGRAGAVGRAERGDLQAEAEGAVQAVLDQSRQPLEHTAPTGG